MKLWAFDKFEEAPHGGEIAFVVLERNRNIGPMIVNEWVVYSKEPFAGPKQVINYLGRYTHRIAISNYRLVKLEGEVVHFKYRDRENPGTSKIKTFSNESL